MARFTLSGVRCDNPRCDTVAEEVETTPPGWIEVRKILDPGAHVSGPNPAFTLCSDKCHYQFARERAGVKTGGPRKKAADA